MKTSLSAQIWCYLGEKVPFGGLVSLSLFSPWLYQKCYIDLALDLSLTKNQGLLHVP